MCSNNVQFLKFWEPKSKSFHILRTEWEMEGYFTSGNLVNYCLFVPAFLVAVCLFVFHHIVSLITRSQELLVAFFFFLFWELHTPSHSEAGDNKWMWCRILRLHWAVYPKISPSSCNSCVQTNTSNRKDLSVIIFRPFRKSMNNYGC